jgi:hypothetical protein
VSGGPTYVTETQPDDSRISDNLNEPARNVMAQLEVTQERRVDPVDAGVPGDLTPQALTAAAHPCAAIFPLMEGVELTELTADETVQNVGVLWTRSVFVTGSSG